MHISLHYTGTSQDSDAAFPTNFFVNKCMTWPGLSFVKQVKVIYNKQDYVLREDLIPKHTLQRPFFEQKYFHVF